MYKVLLVDDDDLIREGLSSILEIKGFEVRSASNGEEAIKLLKQETPDVVVTDIIMPERDGIEVIMHIRKNYKGVKVIAISGGGRINAKDHLEIARQLGVDCTLTKPFSWDTLITEIARIMSST